jgi:hypothetical protein
LDRSTQFIELLAQNAKFLVDTDELMEAGQHAEHEARRLEPAVSLQGFLDHGMGFLGKADHTLHRVSEQFFPSCRNPSHEGGLGGAALDRSFRNSGCLSDRCVRVPARFELDEQIVVPSNPLGASRSVLNHRGLLLSSLLGALMQRWPGPDGSPSRAGFLLFVIGRSREARDRTGIKGASGSRRAWRRSSLNLADA